LAINATDSTVYGGGDGGIWHPLRNGIGRAALSVGNDATLAGVRRIRDVGMDRGMAWT
jgi:hypothetical protein